MAIPDPLGPAIKELLKAAKNGPVYIATVIGSLLALGPEALELYGQRIGASVNNLSTPLVVASVAGGAALIIFACGVRTYEYRIALLADIESKRLYFGSEDYRVERAAALEKQKAENAAALEEQKAKKLAEVTKVTVTPRS